MMHAISIYQISKVKRLQLERSIKTSLKYKDLRELCVSLCMAFAALNLASNSTAYADTKPPVQNDKQTETEVVVKAKTPPVIQKIDRASYDVKSYAEAKTGTIIDIIKKLPGVAVSLDEKLEVRGSSDVIVMIDGKPRPKGSPPLSSIAASDVARVEIITNPSAQFAPDGAIVVNIITLKKVRLGQSGKVTVNLDSLSGSRLNWSLTRTSDKSSLTANLNLGSDSNTSSTVKKNWPSLTTPASSDGEQISKKRSQQTRRGAGIAYSWTLSPHSTLNFDLQTSFGSSNMNEVADLTSPTSSYTQTRAATFTYNGPSGSLRYTFENPDHQEVLRANLSRDEFMFKQKYDDQYRGLGNGINPSEQLTRDFTTSQSLSMEYERALATDVLFTGGFSEDIKWSKTAQSLKGGGAPSITSQFYGREVIDAQFATLQFSVFGIKLMPGLRHEKRQAELKLLNTLHIDKALYPSLHVVYDLSKESQFTGSYSRRVVRPSLEQYSPIIGSITANTFYTGNPDLKPTYVDSYEIAYSDKFDKFSFTATAFNRYSRGVVEDKTILRNDGSYMTQPINAGKVTSKGLEFSGRGSLGKALSYTLDLNAYHASWNQASAYASIFKPRTSYMLKSGLSYAPSQDDKFEMDLMCRSRTFNFQGYFESMCVVNGAISHTINSHLSVVFSAQDLLGSSRLAWVVHTQNIYQESRLHYPSRLFKIGLSYKFGDTK